MRKWMGTALAVLAMTDAAAAHEAQAPGPDVEEIVITARARALEAGKLADTIQQTEVVGLGELRATQSAVLSEALQFSPGVRVNNECSMCAVKRVMLNGLGGQHTTFLIDGLPAHTLVSGFYGPDALSMAGVERIEIARGAGASLTAPEAIGGTINIVTQDPTSTGVTVNAAGGSFGYRQGDAVATYASEDGLFRALVSAQHDERDQVDGDDNGVSESPFLENTNYTARASFDPTRGSTVSLRGAYTRSEVFGGPVIGDTTASIGATLDGFRTSPDPSDRLFAGDDVRNRYIGKPWETTEWIETKRKELSGRYFQELTDDLNADLGVSWSKHEQDSFYEGFDYRADNKMLYLTGRLNWSIDADHLLTVGGDRRDETLRSDSDAARGNPNYISDSFDYLTNGLFVQHTWTPLRELEVATALRLDWVEADFIDAQRPGTDIDETMVSPRIDLRYQHSDQWTSRVSAGRGYRAPLSFFESDHGILDAGQGFLIEVDELETSTSLTYALSYTGERLNWTAALAWTAIDNLAALDEVEIDGRAVPVLTQRDETGHAYGGTIDIGYKLTDALDLSLTLEKFEHDDVMRSIFGVAPIEERAILGLEWHPGAWDIDVNMTWIGPRDLKDYGYDGYEDAGLTIPKATRADAFVTVDARIEYAVTEDIALYVGGRNLFDYTQVKDEETPLFYKPDGGFDVAYIYGPLRGRELYAGTRFSF